MVSNYNLSVYLDESGDLGFDFQNKTPSRYFVITLLISTNFFTLKSVVRKTLRNKVNHQKSKSRFVEELKGTDTTLDTKAYFYRALNEHPDWFLHSVILDKHSINNENPLLKDKHRLYNQLSKFALEQTGILECLTWSSKIDQPS